MHSKKDLFTLYPADLLVCYIPVFYTEILINY